MGYKIKEAREIARMSQEELAEKSGISRTTISQLENNKGDCNLKTLAKLAAALGTTVNAIFFEDGVQSTVQE